MSSLSTADLHSFQIYQLPRPVSPEILERKELKDPFFGVIQSAVKLLISEEPARENALLSIYIDRVTAEIPETEKTEKIVSLATKYSQELVILGQAEAPTPKNADAFETWVDNTLDHAHLFLDCQYVESGIEVTVPEFLQQYLTDAPEELCCFDYALCQIGDIRALLTDYTNADLPGLLIEWGYQPTREMTPGDLVLYLKDGLPTHLGLYRGDGLVQSKWGNNAPIAYLHKLETAPVSYGNQVMIFRPPYEDAS